MISKPRRTLRVALIIVAAAIAAWMIFAPLPEQKNVPMPRPFGMAPPAFKAYLHACRQIGIEPDRLTQTIGDSPRSFG